MILLPQLEHSLRRLYASVNEMPERLQTAESARFYTTFNEVFEEHTVFSRYAPCSPLPAFIGTQFSTSNAFYIMCNHGVTCFKVFRSHKLINFAPGPDTLAVRSADQGPDDVGTHFCSL